MPLAGGGRGAGLWRLPFTVCSSAPQMYREQQNSLPGPCLWSHRSWDPEPTRLSSVHKTAEAAPVPSGRNWTGLGPRGSVRPRRLLWRTAAQGLRQRRPRRTWHPGGLSKEAPADRAGPVSARLSRLDPWNPSSLCSCQQPRTPRVVQGWSLECGVETVQTSEGGGNIVPSAQSSPGV